MKRANVDEKSIVIVYSMAPKDEIGIETLVGEFHEKGVNHGRKFFQKKCKPTDTEGSVFLYFWDNRDGVDFSGWWFGDQVGGTQVWSRCEQATAMPPKTGWRIPWDAQVNKDLVVEPKVTKPALAAKQEAMEEAAAQEKEKGMVVESETQTQMDDRIQLATDRVVLAEIEATQALESANAMMEGEVTEDALRVVEEMLEAQQSALKEANKVLAADMMEARKSSNAKTNAALSKLTPRLRTVQASLAQAMTEAKTLISQKRKAAQEERGQAAAQQKQFEAEQRDTKSLEEALPVVMDAVTRAEDALDAAIAAAHPLTVETGEEMTDEAREAIKETELAATRAQSAIVKAGKELAQRVGEAKSYAPDARKAALNEYGLLKEKLTESSTRLAPFKAIRAEFKKKLEAAKALEQMTTKLNAAEIEVEKVMMSLAGTQPCEEEIKEAEASVEPVMTTLDGVMKFVEKNLSCASGTLKEDLEDMQKRGTESRNKLDEFRVQLVEKVEQIAVQTMLQHGLDRVTVAEEALQQMTIAETPFLKGVENLPVQVASEAIAASEAAVGVAEKASHAATTFLKSKLGDVNRLPQQFVEGSIEELTQLQNRASVVSQRLAVFKRETAVRKTALLLQEVTEKTQAAATKVKLAVAAAVPLSVDDLGGLPACTLKEACEKTLRAEKDAGIALAEARKMLSTKMKDGKAKESTAYGAELTKLQGRLTSMQSDLSKQRKVALVAERLYKNRAILEDKTKEMKTIDEEISRVEILATPLGDEKLSEEAIQQMDAAVVNIQKLVTATVTSLDAAQQTAQGPLKTTLTELLEKAGQSQDRVDEIKVATQEMRERGQCDALLQEARAKLDDVDAAFKQVEKAEGPYLMGIEVALDEATKYIAVSEAAGKVAHKAIASADAFLKTASAEIRSFVKGIATVASEEVASLVKRNKEAVGKLATFKEETEGRKGVALQQEARQKVKLTEEAVEKVVLAAAPLANRDLDDISKDAAKEICEQLGESERDAQSQLDESRKFLTQRKADKKAPMDPAELSNLIGRLNSVQAELAKVRTSATEQEQKFVGRMLVQESVDLVKDLERNIEDATVAAAPLLVDAGKSFVVSSMIKKLIAALSQDIQMKGITKDDLYKEANGGSATTKMTENEFSDFLAKIPDRCARQDLSMSAQQRAAIFEQVDHDADGALSQADFVELFQEKYCCIHEITVTSDLDLSKGHGVGIVKVDDIVEALSERTRDESVGVDRVEIRLTKSCGRGCQGWVTLQGNDSTQYLEPFTAFGAFMKSMERSLSKAHTSMTHATGFLTQKSTELKDCKQGPLGEARMELAKTRPKCSVLQAKLDQLKRKIEDAKREHTKREEAERREIEDKIHRKTVSDLMSSLTETVVNAEAKFDKLTEVAKPLVSAENAETLGNIESPLSLSAAADAAAVEVSETVAEAQASFKANDSKFVSATRGPWLEARRDLAKLRGRIDQVDRKTRQLTSTVKKKTDALVATKAVELASAARASMKAKDMDIDALFKKLADAQADSGEKCLSEKAFGRYVDSVKGLKMSAEQKKALFQHASSDAKGVSRQGFSKLIEQYYKCVKDIAITSGFDIKGSSTSRKLELGEVVEILDGPKTDDIGLSRVQARVVSDGLIGWLTVKGNHGTPFLVETSKPCYTVVEEVILEEDFSSESGAQIRTLDVNEVVEVLEGPRKETVGSALRAHGKASSDGAVGWFTVTSKQGNTCATPGNSCYTIRQAVALTDKLNIKECEVLRKLGKDEVMLLLEGPVKEEKAGVDRIRARSLTDSLEGWVTVKGNAGSAYAEETGKQYVITKGQPLQNSCQSDSATTLRTLGEQETLELLEPAREEKADAHMRMRCRTVSDGKKGWVTLRTTKFGANLEPFDGPE